MTSWLGVAGNIIGAVGVLYQSESEAQILEWNAQAARQDAQLAVLSASVRVEEIRKDGAAVKGAQSAIAAANGLVSTKGSALALLVKSAGEVEKASQRTMFEGEVQAAKFITEANIYKRQAENTRLTGYIQAVSLALSSSVWQRGATSAGPRQSQNVGFNEFSSSSGRTESPYQQQRAGERDMSAYGSRNDAGGATGTGLL